MQDELNESDGFLNIVNDEQIQYDPTFDGPTKGRSCTDIICLLLFLLFIGAWVGVGIFAFRRGNPEVLLIPTDSQGQHCGFDDAVKDKPYLFFFDITKCLSPTTPITGCNTRQMCVKECPDKALFSDQIQEDGRYCYDKNDKTTCPAWVVPSISFEKRCLPDVTKLTSDVLDSITESMHGANSQNTMQIITTSISNIKLLSNVEQVAQQVIADVIHAWWKILIGAGCALVACLIFVLMLRWIAGVIIWLSMIGVVVALAASVYFSAVFYVKYRNEYAESEYLDSSLKTKRDVLLGVLIIASAVLLIILLILIFLHKRIKLAIALVEEGSKAVSAVTSALFFPIIPWVIQIGVVAYAISVGVYLVSVGDTVYRVRNITSECKAETGWDVYTPCTPSIFPTNKSELQWCDSATCTLIGISNGVYYPYFQTFNVFQFFWAAFFVSAFGQMVLAQVFSRWYWTQNKSTLPFFAVTAAIYTTLRYHIGTLAFGSLIIAICRMIRFCLEYIDQKLKKFDNEITRAIMCCLKCFFWCLEKFLKFINKNAYIMCAIHGKNFCTSAKDAFSLLVRNIVRVFVLDKITDFLFFLSKLLITIGVAAVAYLFFASDMIPFMDNSKLNYGIVPVIIIALVTYLIATLFFHVYSMAVDTLFLCFLEDIERNDGKTRPYYMSRNMLKIFGKKNKSD